MTVRFASLAALVAVCAFGAVTGVSVMSGLRGAPEESRSLPLASAPAALQFAVSRELGADDARFRFARTAAGWSVSSTGLTYRIDGQGTRLVGDGWTWGLSLRDAPAGTAWRARANELRVARGSVEEWWVAGPLGVQQGWTVASRPTGGLTLRFDEVGSVRARVEGASKLDLAGHASFEGLSAVDARGSALAVRFVRDGAGFAIRVDDRGAVYPVTVDPWVQQAQLLATGGAAGDRFGSTVSLSGDGAYALVGASRDDVAAAVDQGSAYVFLRTGTSWAQQAQLNSTGGAAGDRFGSSVALSADGLYALVGAPNDADVASGAGKAYVFLRTNASWAEQAAIVATGGAADDGFGSAVALSADGSYGIVGASLDNDTAADAGKAYVFLRTNTSWAEQAAFQSTGIAAGDNFGSSVAISSNGSRALVGAPADDDTAADAGKAYVFLRTNASWAQDGALAASDGAAGDLLGTSVALGPGGTSAAVGAPGDDVSGAADQGSVAGFAFVSNNWIQGGKITVADGAAGDRFGESVARGDSPYLLVGASSDDLPGQNNQGSAYLFKWTGASFTYTAKVSSTGGAADDAFGSASALSLDGAYLFLGAPLDNDPGADGGAAYAFLLDDIYLTSLTPSAGSLSPEFATGTTSYAISVRGPSIQFTTTEATGASIQTRVNEGSWGAQRALPLNTGRNVVDILVIALDTSTRTYTVIVTRQASRAGYCSAKGVFLDLEYGQPDSDPVYQGVTAAKFVNGKGITCDTPPWGYILDGKAPWTMGVPDGFYPYWRAK